MFQSTMIEIKDLAFILQHFECHHLNYQTLEIEISSPFKIQLSHQTKTVDTVVNVECVFGNMKSFQSDAFNEWYIST